MRAEELAHRAAPLYPLCTRAAKADVAAAVDAIDKQISRQMSIRTETEPPINAGTTRMG